MAEWTDGRLVISISRFFQQLASEIRRRKVLRVVAVYAVVAWVVLQVAVVVSEPLGFPSWTIRALIIAAIVGFPVSFLLAWVIDIRPEGLIFDVPLFATVDEPRAQRKSDLIFAGLLILLLSGGAYYLIVKLLNETESLVHTAQDEKVTQAPANSIAVLAFQNFSNDSESEYFAIGLAEEILHLLASLEELNVASPTSSFQFKGEQIDVREVARRLNVSKVLEGSANQFGQRVRAKTYLSDGKTGFSNWVRTFERPANDIFAVQQEIAIDVVDELQLKLSVLSKEVLKKQATESSEAYFSYLKGVGRLRSSLDADVMVEASKLFKTAILQDPDFSKAHAGVCESHLRLYDIRKTVADFDIAEKACRRASELDPGLNGEINLALGKLYKFRGWDSRAEEQLKRAIDISSNPVDAYIELGGLRLKQGKNDQAEKLLKRAISESENYWSAHESLASFYYRTRRYDEAIDEYAKAASLAPDVATVFGGQGAALWMAGEFDLAINAYEQSLRIKPSRQAYTNIGSLHYFAGRYKNAIENQKKALEYAPDDHRVWGRLAESFLFAGEQESAQDAYRQAASLAEENLSINASDWKTSGLLAIYYAHSERIPQSLEMAKSAVALSQQNPEALLFQAHVFLQNNDIDAALSSLEEAVGRSEQYRQFLVTDPFLQTLKDNPRFQALLPKAET